MNNIADRPLMDVAIFPTEMLSKLTFWAKLANG